MINFDSKIQIKEPIKMNQDSRLIALLQDLQIRVFVRLSYVDNARLRGVCKAFRDLLAGEHFRRGLGNRGHIRESFSPLKFFWQDGGLEWIGYNDITQTWDRLPSLRTLVPPLAARRIPGRLILHEEIARRTVWQQNFNVSSSGGLLCAEVSRDRDVQRIIVCNPVTQRRKVLPPLQYRGKPELVRIIADPRTNSYQVIVLGRQSHSRTSSSSLVPEVYSSTSGQWELKSYFPHPSPLVPMTYQSGAVLHGIFFCLSFDQKVIAYNTRTGEWLNPWKCPFPMSFCHNERFYRGTEFPQLVRCNNQIVFFWKKTSVTRTTRLLVRFCFVSLKEFQSGEEPEPVWVDELNPVCYTYADNPTRDSGYMCSAWRSEDGPYAIVTNTVTGVARKCNLEPSLEYRPEIPHLPDPPRLGHNQEVHFTSNPLSFSFEPSFNAAV